MFGGEGFVAVRAPWEPPRGFVCLCVTRHVPTPQHVHRHHVWPAALGGPSDAGNLVWLCPTSHADVHGLLDTYDKVGGMPPWPTRRRHNPYIRLIAHTGWLAIRAAKVQPLAQVALQIGYQGQLPQQGAAA